jgi:hypothetical protein
VLRNFDFYALKFESRRLAESLGDLELLEMLKDLDNNAGLRKDVFVRGSQTSTAEQSLNVLKDVRFTLVAGPEDVSGKEIHTSLGDTTIAPEVLEPMLAALRERPHSLEELAALVADVPGYGLIDMLVVIAVACAGQARTAPPSVCRTSKLALALGPEISEATGQHTLALRLTNRGRANCVLDGYPRVTLRDHAGQIPFSISHGGDQMITSRRPARVVVRPRGLAIVVLNQYRCDRGGLRAADVVSIGLADATRAPTSSITISDPYRKPNYCGRGDPGSTLTVSPFEPSLRAALRH